MGIFSGSFTAETGTVTVEIDGSTIISGSGTFRIMDIGKLEFSNELPNKDQTDPTSIITKQGAFQVTVHDTLTNGNSFFSYLNELELNEQLNCKITVNGLDTLLAIDYKGIEYNARTEHVTLNFRSRWIYTSAGVPLTTGFYNVEYQIVDFYSLKATATYEYDIVGGVTSVDPKGVTLYEMVEDWMNFAYGTGNTTYIKSAERITGIQPTGLILRSVPTGSVADGDDDFIVFTGSNEGTLATISRYAALEGSTFGNAFNVNYYIHRLYTGSDATATFRPEINYNFVEELDISREKSDLRSITIGTYRSNSLIVENDSDTLGLTLNETGEQAANFKFNLTAARGSEYNTASSYYTYGVETVLEQSMVDAGIRAYAKALSADGSRGIRFKFRNALSLKPYQCFTLSSGAPSIFRASGASSVVYRPSRLYYDFKGDYVEGEAYAIAAV